jgi:hypothetical protein
LWRLPSNPGVSPRCAVRGPWPALLTAHCRLQTASRRSSASRLLSNESPLDRWSAPATNRSYGRYPSYNGISATCHAHDQASGLTCSGRRWSKESGRAAPRPDCRARQRAGKGPSGERSTPIPRTGARRVAPLERAPNAGGSPRPDRTVAGCSVARMPPFRTTHRALLKTDGQIAERESSAIAPRVQIAWAPGAKSSSVDTRLECPLAQMRARHRW